MLPLPPPTFMFMNLNISMTRTVTPGLLIPRGQGAGWGSGGQGPGRGSREHGACRGHGPGRGGGGGSRGHGEDRAPEQCGVGGWEGAPVRAPATGDLCLEGGGQVGAHVVCVVCVGGRLGAGGFCECICVLMAHNTTQYGTGTQGPVFLHISKSQTHQAPTQAG